VTGLRLGVSDDRGGGGLTPFGQGSPAAGLADLQPVPQPEVAALPAVAALGGLSVADIVAAGVVAYSSAVLLNDRQGAQAAVARMTRDITDRLRWPAAQLATAQAELSRVLNNLSTSVRRGMSPSYMKEELGGAIAALHQRFASAAPGAPAASPAQQHASGAATAPRLAASRQAATQSPPDLRSAFSAETIQSLQRMLPTQSVVKALTVAGYPPNRAPHGLSSLPAMAAQYAKLQALQKDSQWPALARYLGPEVSAIHASLGQANGAMTRDARQATSLMNAAEQRLHAGTLLSRGQIDGLRATAAQLQGLQTTIQNTYAALHTAGLYEADRHPVATQIATWRASLASRLDAVTQPPAAGPAVPAAVVAASASTHLRPGVDQPAAAVDAALGAIGQWGQLARQWVTLPADATLERRKELEELVMSAGQDLRRALNDSVLKQVMQAGANTGQGDAPGRAADTASASPPPGGKGPDFEELRQRLLNALVNSIGSILGDGLQKQFGAPVSVESMRDGAVIAASLGLVLPPGTQGVFRGSVINGFAGAAETLARQMRGLDPWDPATWLTSFAFGAGATTVVRHYFSLRNADLHFEQLPRANSISRDARDGRSALRITINSEGGKEVRAIRNRLHPGDPEYSTRPVLYVSPESKDKVFKYLQNFDPSQILLRGKGTKARSQVPVTPDDWPRIAVFNWHGESDRFARLSTADAAKHMAREVVEHNRSVGPLGKHIDYVLLGSCHQGTRAGLLPLWGTTNAKRFADVLNAELRRQGAPAIDVLAARDAGLIGIPSDRGKALTAVASHTATDFSKDPVVFVTPDKQRGRLDYFTELDLFGKLVGATGGASVLVQSAKFVYESVYSNSQEGK
jgi:hypothetical protein